VCSKDSIRFTAPELKQTESQTNKAYAMHSHALLPSLRLSASSLSKQKIQVQVGERFLTWRVRGFTPPSEHSSGCLATDQQQQCGVLNEYRICVVEVLRSKAHYTCDAANAPRQLQRSRSHTVLLWLILPYMYVVVRHITHLNMQTLKLHQQILLYIYSDICTYILLVGCDCIMMIWYDTATP
jgi:hypothetical protein